MELCVFTEPQQGASYETLLAHARAAEALGFAGWFRSDHYLTGWGDGLPGPTDAWTTLAGLARETSTIRLGTLVSSVTFRHPGVLAIQVAQVDAMSGGRVELGLGAGWNAAEHAAYGIPFPAKRFGLLEEALEVVEGLWSTPPGERYSFAGEHLTLTDSPALPKPVQPRIPVIVGGGGTIRTPALAARFATEYNIPFVPEPEVAAAFGRVRDACAAQGREGLRYSVAQTTIAGRTRAEAVARAERAGFPLEKAELSGTIGEIADRVQRCAALGADRLLLQVLDLEDLDHLALLAEALLP